jgi:cobalt-zinc-cadmium efflux system outer membrane protein
MRLVRVAGALSFQLATPAVLQAQAPRAAPDLGEVVAIALRQNPDILAARLRIDSAYGEQRIARAIPNPLLNSAPNQPWQYTVTMPLDVTPLRFLRTRAAGRGTEAARADAGDVVRQVTFSVRQAFYDVLLAEQERGLAAERRDIFRQLLVADSVRLRSGDVAPRDVARAELELARADADVLRADAQVHAARLALQLLMGIAAPDTAFIVTGELAYRPVAIPADSLALLAGMLRPDVRAARERVTQSEALRRLAGSLWIPLPDLTLSYQHGGAFAPGDLFTNGSSYSLGFGFTMPLFYWNGGERERSQAGLDQAQLSTRRVQAQISTDVATALDAYRSSRGLAERYEGGLLAKARDVLETTRYAYGTRAISLLELLDAIQTYSETRSDYYTAVHDYWVSVYAVSRAVGKDLVP